MSHHYSGPDLSFPNGDARLDLCDFYVFPKPGDANKTIVIMDVHPSAGINPPGPTTTDLFATEAIYELKIDTDGDAVANIAYRVKFSSENGRISASVRRVEGYSAQAADAGGEAIVEGAPVSTGQEAYVTVAGDYRFFAGQRSDPNFFDAGGALNNFQFTGEDYFADKNVGAIVLELPNSALGSGTGVGLWDRVVIAANDGSGGWTQVERGARALQSVFFCPGEERTAYLGGEPADDARFLNSFAHTLEHSGGYTPEEARCVAGTFLPDIMPYDPTRPASYPGNGRSLTDHATDTFVSVFTNGRAAGDNVKPHTDLLSEFPYLGSPHS
jgi:hypothetical protein